ncbi:MAG: hypothetical protein ACXAAI_10905 [Promethearchaeota archaeon]|jgi:hypothetical protein
MISKYLDSLTMLVPNTTNKIEVVCPICKTRDLIGIPPRSIKRSSHLTTISIHKGLICPHHFQFFIDKNLQIRGYQKVDFELNSNNSKKLRNGIKACSTIERNDTPLFQNLSLNKNPIETKQLKSIRRRFDGDLAQKTPPENKRKSLEEIYEEFWEFIEEDNDIFEEFILKDKRRERAPLYPYSYHYYNHPKEIVNS